MVLNRKEFANYWNLMRPGLGDHYSSLWIPERTSETRIICKWFINIKPIKLDPIDEFWKWCEENLTGQVRCFSSGENFEWWGFTNIEDVTFWLLKWQP